MKPKKKLETLHPEFKAMRKKYDLWQVLCNGGSEIEGKPEYLERHSYESDKQYKVRLWLSTYRNFAKPIVDVFHSSIWRNKPNREDLDPMFADFIENVDRVGTDANAFFKNVSKKAGKKGAGFVVVDFTTLPKEQRDTLQNKKQTDALNLRPFFRFVDASNLIDWGINKNPLTGIETLSYIVFKEEVETSSAPFEGHTAQMQYKLWATDKWEVWVENEKGDAVMIDAGTHPCKCVPVAPCFFHQLTHMTGESAIADVASLCNRTYRLGTCLDKSLYDTAFPLQLFTGFTAEEIEKFQRSSAVGLVSQETGADSKFVEPAGNSFKELRDNIKSDEAAITEIALRMVKSDSKVGVSAESKKMDNLQLNSRLGIFSYNVEDCENLCWELAAKWLGKEIDGNVVYNRDFDEDKVSADIIKAFTDLAREEIIPKEDVLDLLIRSELLPADYDKADAKIKIQNQLRTDTNSPFETMPHAAAPEPEVK
jgi:hypothetical protein